MAIAEVRVRTVVDGGTEEPKPVEKAKLDEAIKAIEAEGMKKRITLHIHGGFLKINWTKQRKSRKIRKPHRKRLTTHWRR